MFALAELLELPVAELWPTTRRQVRFVRDLRGQRGRATNRGAYVEEHNQDFPASRSRRAYLREYTYATLPRPRTCSDMWVRSSERDWYQPEFASQAEAMLARTVEQAVRLYSGADGWRKVEVNASGKPVSGSGLCQATPATNLYLTIDSKIQAIAEKSWSKAYRWHAYGLLARGGWCGRGSRPASGRYWRWLLSDYDR